MQKFLPLLIAITVAGCARLPQPSQNADALFDQLANEYVAGYLAWRPQTGTALGFHEYDGKATDLSRPSLDAELTRLKSFDEKLATLDAATLTPRASYDYRILRGSIQREIFGFEQMKIHSQNPMTYAGSLDVNIY